MQHAAPLLLLATEHPGKGTFRLECAAPGVVAAITAGVDPAALAEVLIGLDAAVRACRVRGDESETTFLAATLRGQELRWARVGDSRLLQLRPGHAIHQLAGWGSIFLGSDVDLGGARRPADSSAGGLVESGSRVLARGEVVLAASDGIDAEFSGVSEARLAEILGADSSLEERVSVLLHEAGRAPGGGRDNLCVVAIEVGHGSASPPA